MHRKSQFLAKSISLVISIFFFSISLLANEKEQTVKKVLTTDNPFVKHIFTADPSAHVFEGKMYVYPSHDRDDAKGFDMTDYHVFSSDDLLKWQDHGVALDIKGVPWAKEFMWAPDCVYKNGMYYLYFPVRNKEGVFQIGVATSKSPAGPFVAEKEPIKASFSVDPAVFIDTDGQAYMYFGGAGMGGQKTPWVAKMTDDMKQFSEAPVALTGVDYWFEACWMNKIGNTYYLSYSTGGKHPEVKGGSGIAYATSENPLGPFKYQGLLNRKVSGWTNHHSVVEWKGQTYFFYHTSDMSGGKTNQRCLAAEFIHVTDDGKLHEVFQTAIGVGRYEGFEKIEAENYHQTNAVTKKGNRKDGFFISLKNKDYVIFNKVDFGDKSAKNIELKIASIAKNGTLEIRENGIKGKVLARIAITNTGGKQNWNTVHTKIIELKSINTIALIFKGKKGEVLELDWIKFSE